MSVVSYVLSAAQEVDGVIVPSADEGEQIRERSVVTWPESQMTVTGLVLGPQAVLISTVTFYFGESSSQRWLLLHTLLAPSYRDVSAELVPLSLHSGV